MDLIPYENGYLWLLSGNCRSQNDLWLASYTLSHMKSEQFETKYDNSLSNPMWTSTKTEIHCSEFNESTSSSSLIELRSDVNACIRKDFTCRLSCLFIYLFVRMQPTSFEAIIYTFCVSLYTEKSKKNIANKLCDTQLKIICEFQCFFATLMRWDEL